MVLVGATIALAVVLAYLGWWLVCLTWPAPRAAGAQGLLVATSEEETMGHDGELKKAPTLETFLTGLAAVPEAGTESGLALLIHKKMGHVQAGLDIRTLELQVQRMERGLDAAKVWRELQRLQGEERRQPKEERLQDLRDELEAARIRKEIEELQKSGPGSSGADRDIDEATARASKQLKAQDAILQEQAERDLEWIKKQEGVRKELIDKYGEEQGKKMFTAWVEGAQLRGTQG